MDAGTVEAGDWWARDRGEQSASWIANYQDSLKARHRNVIVDVISALAPGSVLEVGAHCGPNLMRLARALPEAQLTGVDVSAEAVTAGQQWMAREGLSERVQLQAGRVPDITQTLPDRCVDVVLSCYTLAYISPGDLDAVLWELGRLAAKAIVLAEPIGEPVTADRRMSGYQEWTHHYDAARQWSSTTREMHSAFVPIAPPVDRLNGVLIWTRA